MSAFLRRCCHAADGKITFLTGDVRIINQSKPVTSKLGMLVREGDVIQTGKNAKVGILMSDGSSFHIYQNSTLEVRPTSTYYESKGVISANFVKKSAGSEWRIRSTGGHRRRARYFLHCGSFVQRYAHRAVQGQSDRKRFCARVRSLL